MPARSIPSGGAHSQAARAFADLGAVVEEADPGFTDPIDTLTTLWSAARRSRFGRSRRRAQPDGSGPRRRGGDGRAQPASAYVEALLFARNALAGAMAAFHRTYDLLLTPTLPLPAFEAGRNTPADGSYGEDWTAWTPFTYPFNITQQPAASVPCGITQTGLPAGLQIVGPYGADALVLRAARAFEAAMPFARIEAPRAAGRRRSRVRKKDRDRSPEREGCVWRSTDRRRLGRGRVLRGGHGRRSAGTRPVNRSSCSPAPVRHG